MLRKLNRAFQDYMRPKRLALGKWIWDRKKKLTTEGERAATKENLIEKLDIKSILFLRYDGKIGDMIINTLMFREIKKHYPEIRIGVVTRGAAKGVIVNNPHVDKIYDYNKSNSKLKALAREIEEEGYDLLVDFSEFLRVKQMMFINLCKAKLNMGIDKRGWNLFDISLDPDRDFKWTDHITKRYSAYLRALGVNAESVDYDLFFSDEERKYAQKFYSNLGEEKRVVINPYGASKHKTFNTKTLKNISEYVVSKGWRGIYVYAPDKYEELRKFVEGMGSKNLHIPQGIGSINHTGAIIEGADLVVTPDTSIVHVASALNKPMVCVYPPCGGAYGVDHEVWGPLNENAHMIFCRDKVSEHDEIDINTFNMAEAKEKIEVLL